MRKSLLAVPVALCGLGLAAPHAHATLNPPKAINFSAGPLGTLSAEGVLSAAGTWQSNPVTLTGPAAYGTDRHTRLDITNAELILQKTTGLVQFFVMAGSYNFPTLGEPILPTPSVPNYYYGAVPEAYITLAPTSHFSVEVGKLPTLMGGEYTWSWMNQNIERGLLWNSENAVSRGAQVNYSMGPVSASLSFNDGYYSNHYNVLTGLFSYALNKNNTASVFFYHHFGSTVINDSPQSLNHDPDARGRGALAHHVQSRGRRRCHEAPRRAHRRRHVQRGAPGAARGPGPLCLVATTALGAARRAYR